MIALFGRDDYSALGIASILDIEKIPYRRISTLAEHDQDLLVAVGTDLSAEESLRIASTPSLVFHGGSHFAREVFAAGDVATENRPCAIPLSEPIWPEAVRDIAARFGKRCLCLPLAPVCETGPLSSAALLARTEPDYPSGREAQAAIARRDNCVWSLIDFGTAFTNLMTEDYLPAHRRHGPSSRPKALARQAAEHLYYSAPKFVRQWAQRTSYNLLERQLRVEGAQASEYPVDATGWLLIELVKSLIKLAAGSLVRLERWPNPYRAAATLTHDVEPRRYAYTRGLERLLHEVAALGHGAALGLVAHASDRFLTDDVIAQLNGHEIMCHGLTHRGEVVWGRAQAVEGMQQARVRLQRRLRRRISGYRSPRLDRSSDLAAALDHCEFDYDSSYPDVDRENVRHFGGGVRLNVPYRPPVDGGASGLRPSRCLELPLTAPDCIQPLLAGQSEKVLRSTVEVKASFVREVGGLYVALVHAGVFGDEDATVRSAHLRFMYQQFMHPDVWLAGIEQIVEWWRAREAVRVSLQSGTVQVHNDGSQPVVGVRVIVGYDADETVLPVPPLAPGEGARLSVPCGDICIPSTP